MLRSSPVRVRPSGVRPTAVALVLLIGLLTSLVGAERAAVADTEVPRELEGIEIEDRVGEKVPADVTLTDQDGRKVSTADFLDGKTPVLLVLSYFDCPMLCSLVLNGLLDGMKGMSGVPGEDYRVLVVSFDSRDDALAARKKRESYLGAFVSSSEGGRAVKDRGFDFTVGDEAEVRRLADAVGFKYRWDEDQKQFAHGAAVFVVSPEGQLTRTLPGIGFPAPTLESALSEAREGVTTHSPLKQMLLFCYQYDARAGSWVLAGWRIMRIGGVLTMLVLGFFLFRLFRREREPSALSPKVQS